MVSALQFYKCIFNHFFRNEFSSTGMHFFHAIVHYEINFTSIINRITIKMWLSILMRKCITFSTLISMLIRTSPIDVVCIFFEKKYWTQKSGHLSVIKHKIFLPLIIFYIAALFTFSPHYNGFLVTYIFILLPFLIQYGRVSTRGTKKSAPLMCVDTHKQVHTQIAKMLNFITFWCLCTTFFVPSDLFLYYYSLHDYQ